MTLPILKGLPQGYLHSLFDEGTVNDQFSRIHILKRTRGPDCVVKLIEAHFGDVDAILSDLSHHIDASNVDFSKLAALAREIEVKSTRAVKLACPDLIQACDDEQEKRFAPTLMWVKNEFTHTKNKLESYVQGIVNDQFNRIHSLRRTEEPDCVVKLIEAYFGDVEAILSDLSRHVDASNVDLSKLAALAREIEDKSTSIGAEHVRLACPDLIQACDEKHKKRFVRSLMWVKNEFTHTKNKLESYVRMERRIIRHRNSQSQSSSSS